MSDEHKAIGGIMVRAGRRDLVPVGPVNPLVARGITDLAKIQEEPEEFPNSSDFAALLTRARVKVARLKASRARTYALQSA